MNWGRLLTAMVTPFDSHLRVHYDRACELARWLLDHGSDGVVISGTTGESPTLNIEEKLRLFAEVKCAVGDRGTVIANTGSYNTEESVALTRAAEGVEVDGIMAVVPYYNNPPQEGLYRHFRAIAQSTELPVILYNVPSRSPRNLEAGTVARLAADVPNIRVSKEAKNDMEQVRAIAESTPDDYRIYSGEDANTLGVMENGGVGVISVASHVVGPQMKRMIDLFAQGETEQARQAEADLLPVFTGLFATTNPILVKAAIQMTGLDCGGLRLPLVEATDAERDELKRVLETHL
ncbi:MAG: 4-hydroxy-tetrahydrodipicolinate synthase [Armatimonadetes bacterium]|nr:4-hydroxy-tetrahydrodipicolinate synthase [Armatimonadota bacterium]